IQPSPPCAIQPTTSYWPATRSPGFNFGANEYSRRHFGQKPSVRPGLPGRERPTGAPHAEQKRFSSGTSGFASTTERGSGTGSDGTVVMRAPRCCMRLLDARMRRVGRLAPEIRAEPIGVVDNLVEMPEPRTLADVSPAGALPLPPGALLAVDAGAAT